LKTLRRVLVEEELAKSVTHERQDI